LSFTAPKEPGAYPYLCTYPGHWRRMFGALYVVEDLEGYLAGPEAYLQAHPVPVDDPLLKLRRGRTEWKLEDLAPSLANLAEGRAYSSGKQMFQVAGCVACHRLAGMGTQLGGDLAQLDAKMSPAEMLLEILEPSRK